MTGVDTTECRKVPPFGCGVCGIDDISSFFRCPLLARVLYPLLSIPPPDSLAESFCLTAMPSHLLARRALGVSLPRASHNILRSSSLVPSDQTVYSILLARLRKYARDDLRLAVLLRRGTWSLGRFALPAPSALPRASL